MSVLESGFDLEHKLYFGDVLNMKTCTEYTAEEVNDVGVNDRPVLDPEELRRGVVSIQQDDVSAEDLVTSGKTVSKRWSIWTVNDIKYRINVTVLWRAVRSGVNRTRMICATCLHEQSQFCRHELACEAESRDSKTEEYSSGS